MHSSICSKETVLDKSCKKNVVERDRDNKHTTFAHLKQDQTMLRHLPLSRNANSNPTIDYQPESDVSVFWSTSSSCTNIFLAKIE